MRRKGISIWHYNKTARVTTGHSVKEAQRPDALCHPSKTDIVM